MKTKKTLSKWLVILLTTLSMPVLAQFSGSGSGTSADPFIITSGDELNQVRNYLNNANVYFKMLNDVDLTQWIADNNPTQGWNPIGNSSTNGFGGYFDGNGFKIIGLKINRPTTDYVGLFGYIGFNMIYSANIHDLTLSQCAIIGQNYVGSLAGCAGMGPVFKNISIQGNLKGINNVGLLAGSIYNNNYKNSVIKNITINGNVTGNNYTGLMAGSIQQSVSYELTSYTMSIDGIDLKGDIVGISNVGGLTGDLNCNAEGRYGGTTTVSLSNISMEGNLSGQGLTGGVIGNIVSNSSTVDAMYSENSYIYISKIFFKGDVKGQAKTGGLFGNINQSSTSTTNNAIKVKIENSGFNGTVSGSNNTGGLVGYITESYRNIIDRCFFSGNVSGLAGCGGILGESGSLISITNCHSHGDISGTTSVGGIVGKSLNPYILKNYSAGNVRGTSNVGGIIGESVSGGSNTVQSNVSINNVISGASSVGRITGLVNVSETLTSAQSNYGWALTNVIVNNITTPVVDSYQHGITSGISLFKTKATYQGIGWDFTTANYWRIVEGQSFPYFTWQTPPAVITTSPIKPGTTTISGTSVANALINLRVGTKEYSTTANSLNWSINVDPLLGGDTILVIAQQDTLRWSYQVRAFAELLGSGTVADPYQIYTAKDLSTIENYISANFKLMNDIDLTSWIQTTALATGWLSIGNKGGSLKGSLDGQNHKITGFWQNSSLTSSGLVSSVSSSGAVRNLTIEPVTGKNISGLNYTAILVGYNYGTIENCKVSGTVQGYNVGCIAGFNSGTIKNCIGSGSIASIVSSGKAGGIAGDNTGLISKCEYTGDITCNIGSGYLGGITSSSTDSVVNCYYSGTLTSSIATSHIGGIVGLNSGLISTSFSLGTISASGATAYAGGIAGDNNSTTSEINNSESGINITSTGASTVCGGIVGLTKGKVTNCYALGNIASAYRGSGVVGYMDGTSALVKGCVGLNTNISGKNSVCRVLGGVMNSATAPALTDNYGCKDMLITINGVAQSTPADNYMQGTAKDRADLKKQSFYEGMGWSFTSNWYIIEGFDYPYLRFRLQTVIGVTLNKSTTNLNVGSTETLTATVAPTNATYQNINWSSSNVAVATVDATGKVTAVSGGTTTITATTVDQSKTAQCVVTVVQPVTGVTLNKSTTTLSVSATETLTATIAPTTANNQNVTWSSSNTAVATVDATGKVSAIAAGTATITVTTLDQSKTAQCVVTVVQSVIGVTLNKLTTTLNVSATETLTATLAPTTATNKNITWLSNNTAVATVDATGKITAVAVGTATITVTTVDQSKTAQCIVTVVQTVTGVSLNKSTTTLNVSATETLTATLAPTTATNKNVTWLSNNMAVATVDASGKITAVAVGSATITVTTVDQSKTAQCVVTVVQQVTGITLNKSTTTLKVNATETLTASVAPTSATNNIVTWFSNNTAVATVDATGKITAVSVGTATITVTTVDQSKTAQCVVTVILNVGLNDIINESFNIYPNPVINMIFIKSDLSIIKAEIYSVNGQLMQIKVDKDLKNLDVSGLVEGLYTIRFFRDDKAIITRQIVKE